jgi:hypothetical protein
LPAASAIIAADGQFDVAVDKRIKRREVALAGHAKDVTHAVDAQLSDENLGGGAIVILAAHHSFLGGHLSGG